MHLQKRHRDCFSEIHHNFDHFYRFLINFIICRNLQISISHKIRLEYFQLWQISWYFVICQEYLLEYFHLADLLIFCQEYLLEYFQLWQISWYLVRNICWNIFTFGRSLHILSGSTSIEIATVLCSSLRLPFRIVCVSQVLFIHTEKL